MGLTCPHITAKAQGQIGMCGSFQFCFLTGLFSLLLHVNQTFLFQHHTFPLERKVSNGYVNETYHDTFFHNVCATNFHIDFYFPAVFCVCCSAMHCLYLYFLLCQKQKNEWYIQWKCILRWSNLTDLHSMCILFIILLALFTVLTLWLAKLQRQF